MVKTENVINSEKLTELLGKLSESGALSDIMAALSSSAKPEKEASGESIEASAKVIDEHVETGGGEEHNDAASSSPDIMSFLSPEMLGMIPKLAALISIMPQSVLGGAAVMMFSSIVISGIQLIVKEPLTARNMTIVSVALGLGYGIGANGGILSQLPEAVRLIFGGSGIVPAALVAMILNVCLPRENKEELKS